MKRIVLATPLASTDLGGPVAYVDALAQEFRKRGMQVTVVSYGRLERYLPLGLRHFAYFCRLFPQVLGARSVLAFDTWSVGLPACVAARLVHAKCIVRIGGDFLWESYVARTKELVRLSDFYRDARQLSLKERIIRFGTRLLLRHVDHIVFTTLWQSELWQSAYRFPVSRATVVENYVPIEREAAPARSRTFVSAGRAHPLKNRALLEAVFATVHRDYPDIRLDTRVLPPEEHRLRLRDCYAVVIASISEVNPNTAVDAIRFGKPFIAPRDSGGYARLKSAGMCIDTRDAVTLEAALRSLLDPTEYQAACERSRDFSYSHTWEQVAGELEPLL